MNYQARQAIVIGFTILFGITGPLLSIAMQNSSDHVVSTVAAGMFWVSSGITILFCRMWYTPGNPGILIVAVAFHLILYSALGVLIARYIIKSEKNEDWDN